MDKISVVITCYKKKEPLDRAFKSLEAQTDRDFEIIIINDASTDKQLNATCKEIERHGKARIIWHKRRRGTSAARNTGCQVISGDIYVPLDADDELPPNAIAIIRKMFREAPEADFIFGNYVKNDVEKHISNVVNTKHLCGSGGYLNPKELARGFILYGGSPFRKSLWLKINGYDESVKSGAEDVDFWLRALVNGAQGKYANETLYIWHKSRYGMNARILKNYWFYINQVKNSKFYSIFSDDKNKGSRCLRIYKKMPPYLSVFIINLHDIFNIAMRKLFLDSTRSIRGKLGLRKCQLFKISKNGKRC